MMKVKLLKKIRKRFKYIFAEDDKIHILDHLTKKANTYNNFMCSIYANIYLPHGLYLMLDKILGFSEFSELIADRYDRRENRKRKKMYNALMK